MRPSIIATLVTAAALSACGPTVSYQRAPDVRIAAGSRWAWSPADADGPKREQGAMIPEDSTARRISGAIEAELIARGFPVVSADQAQFLVHFHVARRSVTDTLPPREDPSSSGGVVRTPGAWGGYGNPEELADRLVSWEEGTLVIDALTPDRRIVAWRGIIAGEVPVKAETRPDAAIREAVQRLLRGFP
ncbi:MAG: DUF4136 domain-containing protein [Gemmatimonadetes bacterium]|nr:DUF4136 domain-containing protein [Gemmatimonadota bacterium]